MRLDRLVLKHFLTFENLDYSFEEKPLLVQGLNLTDDKQKSNGSGKSGMQTGIEFCIAASNSRDVRDFELVTFGQDSASAELYASCDIRKEQLHIAWTIKVKGSNQLKLRKKTYKGDWEEVTFSTVNDGKKYVTNWFGIDKEDLFNYFIINKTRFKSFFKSSNKEKVDLINRFSDASIIEGLEKVNNTELEGIYDDLKSTVSRLEGRLEGIHESIQKEAGRNLKAEMAEEAQDIEDEIEWLKEGIQDHKDSIEEAKAKQIDIKSQIEESIKTKSIHGLKEIQKTNELTTAEEELNDVVSQLDDAQILVDNFILTDWSSRRKQYEDLINGLGRDVDLLEDESSEMKAKEKKILKFLQGIEIKLAGTITCPKCSHEFVLDTELGTEEAKEDLIARQKKGVLLEKTIAEKILQLSKSIESVEELVEQEEFHISTINKSEQAENLEKNLLRDVVNKINNTLNDKRTQIADLKGEVQKYKAKQKDCDDDGKDFLSEIRGFDGDIKDYKAGIKNTEEKIAIYKEKKDNLKVNSNKSIIKELQGDLLKIEKEKKLLEEELTECGDKIYERNQWMNNFKQFRMFLANQSLETIEFHCNRYLQGMGSDLIIQMEGYKELANGTYKDEITAKVIRDVERSFSSYSGGEQGRLLFASILANRHMINLTHPYGGLDFLSVDEVFEGVDGIGLKSLIDSAKQLKIAVMIITHVTDEELDDNILLIVKENGISTIKAH
jgi:DNA repair exonuclease SbcCD ATPase subunit